MFLLYSVCFEWAPMSQQNPIGMTWVICVPGNQDRLQSLLSSASLLEDPKAVGSALGIQVLPSFVQVISVFKNVIECWLFNAKYWLCSHLLCTPTPYSPYSCAAPKAFGVKFCVWGVLWSTGLWRWEYFLWWSAEGYFHLSCVALGGGGRLLVREIFYINILHKLTRFSLREPFISHHHPEFLLIHTPAQTTSFLCKQQEGQKEEEC